MRCPDAHAIKTRMCFKKNLSEAVLPNEGRITKKTWSPRIGGLALDKEKGNSLIGVYTKARSKGSVLRKELRLDGKFSMVY